MARVDAEVDERMQQAYQVMRVELSKKLLMHYLNGAPASQHDLQAFLLENNGKLSPSIRREYVKTEPQAHCMMFVEYLLLENGRGGGILIPFEYQEIFEDSGT